MVRQTASTIVLEILGGLILLVLVCGALLAARLANGPVKLSMLKDDVEKALTDGRQGRKVELGDIFLEWSSADRRVLINAHDVQLFDAAGDLAAEADRSDIVLSGSSLVLGKIEVLGMNLDHGWINVDSITDTRWTLAGDPLPEIPAGELPQTLAEWRARANEVLPNVLLGVEQVQSSISLESVSLEDFEVRVRAPDQSRLLTLSGAKGRMTRKPDGLLFALSGRGVGKGLPAGIAVTLDTSQNNERLRAEFAIAEWPLAELARRLGLDAENFEGLPGNLDISFDVTKEAGIEQVITSLDVGKGVLPIGTEGVPVADLKVLSTYSAGSDELSADISTSGAGPFSGAALITLQDAFKDQAFHRFTLASPTFQFDFTPQFAAPVELTNVVATGEIGLKEHALRSTSVTFTRGEDRLEASGSIMLTPDRQPGEPRILGSLDFASPGNLSKDTVLAFWPVGLGAGARRFAVGRVEEGVITSATGHLDLSRDSLAAGYLRDEDLNLDFTITGGKVRFADDLPPVESADGKGHLSGNSFKVIVERGEYGGWAVDDGVVDFPAFNPKGVDFRVFAKGHGPAQNVMKTLVESQLKLDFEPERLSGDAELTFEMFRPALDNVPYDKIRFTAIGSIKNAGLKAAALGFDLTDGALKVDTSQDGIAITGFGQLGPTPVQFTWRDGFNDDDAPSNLSATAVVTPDVLNSFGLLGRAYLTGEVPVELQAKLGGEQLESAEAALDLGEARIDISEIGWVKPKGAPGKASVSYKKVDGRIESTVLFKSEQAFLDIAYTLGADDKLVSAALRRAYLADTADVGGSVSRTDDGVLNLNLTGTYLDLSGAMSGLGAMGSSAEGNKTPLRISADIETLTLRPGLDMRKASVTAETSVNGIALFTASGNANDGSPLSAAYDAAGSATGATIHIVSGNAGFMAQAFMDVDFLEGGDLDLVGTLPRDQSPAKFEIGITNARLRNAPFLTQILSLASLRGLADTLGGEGVLFSRIDVPLTISNGRYVVTGAKAQGPALGLTASGFMDGKSNAIEFDGVLVPSFGMNSALGGIPIIGDLVVGRDGEGVFSLTYGIRGTLEKASVSVNPLSALAPGVIRRIFENPSDTKIPEAKPRTPDEPIPSELPPIPEETFE